MSMFMKMKMDKILAFRRLLLLSLLTICFATTQGDTKVPTGVTMKVTNEEVVLDNGILQITIANPQGYLSGVRYGGVDNLLEKRNPGHNRGYWDVVWDAAGYNSSIDMLLGSKFNVVVQRENRVEVSFTNKWDSTSWTSSQGRSLPVNVDRRYIMLSGSSGFYSYATLEREKGWPAVNVSQIRAVFKLDQKQFHYMAISDDRQRIMPMPEDRDSGQTLGYKEAVLLTNPSNPDLRGEVDDKYQYSCEDKDNKVHGWISTDPQIGFWVITPSDEFRMGGPVKQDLTSHVGPTSLAMFHSSHYAGYDVIMTFQEEEPWKKVFGPFFVYLNSASKSKGYRALWNDAKHQMTQEVRSWPYGFPASEDFPKSVDRGFAYGRLLVRDRYRKTKLMPASAAWIGLAAPGEAGSWQTEAKGYQFWTKADRYGGFMIKGIREGVYNLYAWVPGFIGDYVYERQITISAGSALKLGDLIYEPPRNGPTLWEIGIPDRTAFEFFVPETSTFVNKLYTNSDMNKFRQYGLWERYAQLYPDHDLVYTVGVSDYHKDWFFAHVTRKGEGTTYKPTTWQIIFPLENVIPSGNYTMRLALASATRAEVQVRFNNPGLAIPHFRTMKIGTDNAIARHGIHGLYRLYNINVPSEWLRAGNNTIYLRQPKHESPFYGVMYDYIRLEGPSSTA